MMSLDPDLPPPSLLAKNDEICFRSLLGESRFWIDFISTLLGDNSCGLSTDLINWCSVLGEVTFRKVELIFSVLEGLFARSSKDDTFANCAKTSDVVRKN